MIAATAARLAGSPRGRAGVAAAAIGGAVLLALSSGAVAPLAARGALAAAAIGTAALLVRRRTAPGAPAPIAVVARAPLPGGTGLAVVEAGSRRLLVGFGRDGVRLVAELGPAEGRRP